jgi:hypothetical protein
MRQGIVVLASLVLLGSNADSAKRQLPSVEQGLSLHFPRTIDPSSLSIRYYMTGGFGGYGGFIRTKSDTWDYSIETSYEGKPARTLKAILFYPGYEVKLIDIPSLDDSATRNVDVELRPLPLIRLSGKVILPKSEASLYLKLNATYCAYWDREFFGIIDGFVSSFDLGSTDVAEGGSFSMMVPDFAQDPAVNSFKDHGAIQLIARDRKTRYWLDRGDKSGGNVNVRGVEIQADEDYGELILHAKPFR